MAGTWLFSLPLLWFWIPSQKDKVARGRRGGGNHIKSTTVHWIVYKKLLTVKEKKPEYVKEMETGQLNNNCTRGSVTSPKIRAKKNGQTPKTTHLRTTTLSRLTIYICKGIPGVQTCLYQLQLKRPLGD